MDFIEISNVYKYLKNEEITQEKIIQRIKESAFNESKIFSELKFPINTILQFRQIKLYCMIIYIFDGIVPTEHNVAEIFHISKQSALSLLNATLSTYAKELREKLILTIKNCLKNVKEDNGTYYIKIDSSFLISAINNELELNKTDLEPVRKLNHVTSYYKLSKEVIDYFNKEVEV